METVDGNESDSSKVEADRRTWRTGDGMEMRCGAEMPSE